MAVAVGFAGGAHRRAGLLALLLGAGVVGVFHVPEMGELKHHIDDSRYQKQDDDGVVDVRTEFCLFYKAAL